jgi:hypothetical protein
MKISKEDLKILVERVLVEEAAKANIGIDSTMLNTVIKDLTKVKEGKVDMRQTLSPSQFDEFNKALNKIYSLIDLAK